MKAKVIGIMQICAGWVGLLIGAIFGSLFDLYFYGDVGVVMTYATVTGAVTGIIYTVMSLQAVLKQHQIEENLS